MIGRFRSSPFQPNRNTDKVGRSERQVLYFTAVHHVVLRLE